MHYGVGGNGALGGGFVDNKGLKIFSRLVTEKDALFRGSAKLLNSFKKNFENWRCLLHVTQAIIGSIREARRAGIQHAMAATPNKRITTAEIVAGSRAPTPKRKLLSNCPPHSAASTPSSKPPNTGDTLAQYRQSNLRRPRA
jgi:hypothetical protein